MIEEKDENGWLVNVLSDVTINGTVLDDRQWKLLRHCVSNGIASSSKLIVNTETKETAKSTEPNTFKLQRQKAFEVLEFLDGDQIKYWSQRHDKEEPIVTINRRELNYAHCMMVRMSVSGIDSSKELGDFTKLELYKLLDIVHSYAPTWIKMS